MAAFYKVTVDLNSYTEGCHGHLGHYKARRAPLQLIEVYLGERITLLVLCFFVLGVGTVEEINDRPIFGLDAEDCA